MPNNNNNHIVTVDNFLRDQARERVLNHNRGSNSTPAWNDSDYTESPDHSQREVSHSDIAVMAMRARP